ncbi:MAG: group II intron reverse transcriptase/maturase [Syntrophobacterales bacterium]|nr:MAG: group II intron reverse transcriptase/maturase [Syntrophobacterales bacterium]
MKRALRQVLKNKGAPGIDGMTVEELPGYLKRHWPEIKALLLSGQYRPLPVLRTEIKKPDGGLRPLGIPTVLDRVIQQAIAQVLDVIWDQTFSEFSYGFRKERSQHMAIQQAKSYIKEGHMFVVDLDLEKFFDRVNHDRLMSRLSTRVPDKRVLKLIGAILRSGVMIGGLCEPTEEGTPQGGPLSPLMSNIVLDELDKELERRGLHFVRYADDCVIYVKSKSAGDRVKESISRFIARKLKLKVNEAKSCVTQPGYTKYLGFGFTISKTNPKIRIHSKSLKRFRERVREITVRTRGYSIQRVIAELNEYIRGWWAYFSHCEARTCLVELNAWVIRRLRAYIWKQWKLPRTRVCELIKRGISQYWAVKVGTTRKGVWRLSENTTVAKALPVAYFCKQLGLVLPG